MGVGRRLDKICVLGKETHLKSERVCTCARMWLRVHVCVCDSVRMCVAHTYVHTHVIPRARVCLVRARVTMHT